MKSMNIPMVGQNQEKTIKPTILLGCDNLWTFIRNDIPSIPLPSGLLVLPTKLGYLLSGRINPQEQSVLQVTEQKPEEFNQWDKYFSMDSTQTYTISSSEMVTTEEEKERWNQFWSLDAAGTEEYTKSEKENKALIDTKVWERRFNHTIQQREDGYYVRLPWIENHPHLPDNRALAYKRLVNVWASISKEGELLEQYNNVFQDQRSQGIIEDVDETILTKNQIHYIPHQPVVTPQKTTTKLRIVFDASAHYKGCRSLNDVLHSGPIMLPSLFGTLLRVRIGKIAIISDVEKAFLQIRLQEQDRDATRCLWLRNYKLPPAQDNVRTYRFTRVTFGLKSSPFLLAGTIHHHLSRYKDEIPFVEEVRNNLYVDNLISTTDTVEEGLTYYQKAKQVFKDLNMNLREFSTNCAQLEGAIQESDRASQQVPKILGLTWDTLRDTIKVTCNVSATPIVTKRTITSALASIYDPMGWLVPMLFPIKRFLQGLWRNEYAWDTVLPTSKQSDWNTIITGVNGFTKTIPRFLTPKKSVAHLICFADASTNGMAACAYLWHDRETNLLMAKSKLPSLRNQYTIPKLELNATTLALRLSRTLHEQLSSLLIIKAIYVFTDSEIVLSWLKLKPGRDVGPFIQNRLIEIHNIVNSLKQSQCKVKFGYVPSSINPADSGTRGLTKDEMETDLWWRGPSFISKPPSSWPPETQLFEYDENDHTDEDSPCKDMLALCTREHDDSDLVTYRQARTFKHAKRIMAYVLRFVIMTVQRVNTNHPRLKIKLSLWEHTHPLQFSKHLSGPEISLAAKILICHHQNTKITKSIRESLRQLNLREDNEGILRCYGRLGRSQLPDAAKYPILILQKTALADSIIEDYHQNGHPGINHTVALVRQKFWIPQLRAQVTRKIRKCIPCQRFNNLPFKYPSQEDMPKERVVQSYPFQHIGLDYFGPITILAEKQNKCYGSIITCMTTRLIHLDLVADMSTTAFLRMLRRFFARKGVPQTITSDNAPTFVLGEEVLKDSIDAARTDPSVCREFSNREIEWRYITPYAPWQGGFYERLIKSVKHCLYKTISRSIISYEELSTILAEIESILNNRPLTYITSAHDEGQILRPIDFVQKDIKISLPLKFVEEEEDDPQYNPSELVPTIQTKQQAIRALESSCRLTEKFWHLWQTEYLTALREKHTLQIGKKAGCSREPTLGTPVLISDPAVPRHMWKLGMIDELIKNSAGTIREAAIRLPSRRLIRRPINLLIPLELDDEAENERHELSQSSIPQPEHKVGAGEADTAPTPVVNPRYNLRKRKKVNYSEDNDNSKATSVSIQSYLATVVQILITLTLVTPSAAANNNEKPHSLRSIQCISGGVQLSSPESSPYEICTEQYCLHIENPKLIEFISLPPQIVLHEHRTVWKFVQNESIQTMEVTCQPGSFCHSIRCIFCFANMLNPECWPTSALIASGISIYLAIVVAYVLFKIILVLSQPIRLLSKICWGLTKLGLFIPRQLCHRRHPQSSRTLKRSIAQIIALSMIVLSLISVAEQCQHINLFTHQSTMCKQNSQQPCQIQLSEVFKINSFKKEACMRLSQNRTMVHEIQIHWKSLTLICEEETDLFTRDTTHKVVDSKRCPHMGSCIDEKCGAINASSLIPELEIGNQYPGHTACVASCGGPGCDCFYLSSGCLFYRIYLEPLTSEIYRIFHCNRWKERAELEVNHYSKFQKQSSTTTIRLQPNIPMKLNSFTIALTSVGVPPFPLLNTKFITNGKYTAFWQNNVLPPLRCTNDSRAKTMNCKVFEDCTCLPAETSARCRCRDLFIGRWFSNIKNRLPVTFPPITFHYIQSQVQAAVTTGVTSELILNFQEVFNTTVMVGNDICQASAGELTGCYNCAKGAKARVTCISSQDNAQAEILCGTTPFTIPCNRTGAVSSLLFNPFKARVSLQCTCSCGEKTTTFEISGILEYTTSGTDLIEHWIKSNSLSQSEIAWPDFSHITTVFLQWYKTLATVMVALIILLGVTYIFFATYGIRITMWILLLTPRLIWAILKSFLKCVLYMTTQSRHNKQY